MQVNGLGVGKCRIRFSLHRSDLKCDSSLRCGAVRAFDQDGNIALIDSARTKTYGYDDAFRITSITDTTNCALSWAYGYDDLDRLTGAQTGTTCAKHTIRTAIV
jgi:YD repeat-containing protein